MLRIFSQSGNESMSLKLSAKRRSLVGWQLKSQIVSLAGLISPISPFTKSVPIVQREKYYIVFGALCQNIQPKLQQCYVQVDILRLFHHHLHHHHHHHHHFYLGHVCDGVGIVHQLPLVHLNFSQSGNRTRSFLLQTVTYLFCSEQ